MPDPSSPPSSRAVFLSYAREDTEAARRIAEALRSSGIEVWFDQNELRGGDTWDAKIRKQINDCTLFLPIISRNTQERNKGYFRLEWRLAVEQTHLMLDGVPFLAPVAVDDTPEAGAAVPPEFMKVQWTRLPGALPTPQFVEQIQRLLGGGSKLATSGGQSPSLKATASQAGQRMEAGAASRKSWLMPTIVGVVVAAGLAFFMLRKPAAEPVTPGIAATPAPVEKKTAKLSDKSIAVLPFTNMSDDKDTAFFTDGVHEDILTNLALIRELRVVSRTSVMQYRDTKKAIGQIAQELGVTYILEGSIRRSGNKVRVTGQLIHAGTDEHVWAQTYDRDLTDIFTIQTELSQQIAGALKAALSPEEKVRIARQPTQNPAAYDLYLHARDVRAREGANPAAIQKQITLLQSAVELDPSFAEAWGELADAEAYGVFTFRDGMEAGLARGKAAIERAVKLAPNEPEVIRSLGTFFYYGYRDYAKATEQYQKLAQQHPNDPTNFNALSLIQRRQGNWKESAVNGRRAVALDPANAGYLRNLFHTLINCNQWDEGTEVQKKMVALLPDQLGERYTLVSIPFYARGSTRETDDFFAHLSKEEADSPEGIGCRRDWASSKGDWAEAIRLDRLQSYFEGSPLRRAEQANVGAQFYYSAGDRQGAIARLGDTPAELRRLLATEPKNARNWAFLALAEAMLGHPEEAVRCAERGVELLPESVDALDGPVYARTRANIYDWTGDKERALAEYARLARTPSGLNVYALKTSYSTLQGDPRFEALIADPKNNGPLF